MKRAKQILEINNIRPSYHRVRILAYLHDHRNHPTADQIFHDLLDETQTISKVTVYNSLNVLKEKEIIHTLDLAGEETRYDIETRPHAHFKCTECGEIKDVDYPEDSLRRLENAENVTEVQLLFKGKCANCDQSKVISAIDEITELLQNTGRASA